MQILVCQKTLQNHGYTHIFLLTVYIQITQSSGGRITIYIPPLCCICDVE